MTDPNALKKRLDEGHEQIEGWKPREGDELIGRVARVNIRQMDDENDYPVVTVVQADGSKLAFHAKPLLARTEIEEQQPRPGDEIAIRYLGRKQGKTYEYHDYTIVVVPGDRSVADDESTAATQQAQQAERDAIEDIPF